MRVVPLREAGGARVPELARKLTALPELGLRVGWLGDWIQSTGPGGVAVSLDELATVALGGSPTAREALLAVAVFLSSRHESDLIGALWLEAEARALLSLGRMVRPGPPAQELEVSPPVPRYAERELTLGERRSLARRPTRLQIEKLLLDPDPLVLTQLLKCPTLTEADVLSVATSRSRAPRAFEAVVTSNRWILRPRIRHALVQNPRAPHALALPLLATLMWEDLIVVQRTTTVSPILRLVANELLERLPPFGDAADSDSPKGSPWPH